MTLNIPLPHKRARGTETVRKDAACSASTLSILKEHKSP